MFHDTKKQMCYNTIVVHQMLKLFQLFPILIIKTVPWTLPEHLDLAKQLHLGDNLIPFCFLLRTRLTDVAMCQWVGWPLSVGAVPIFTGSIPGDVGGGRRAHRRRHKELSIQIASVPLPDKLAPPWS